MLFALVAFGVGDYFVQRALRQNEARASAKLIVSWREFHSPSGRVARDHGTVEEVLESTLIAGRARERVRALHPSLTEAPVKIRADLVDRVFHHYTVTATGSSQDYTVKYLDSLLDEFRGFVMDLRHQMDAPSRAEIETLEKQLNTPKQSDEIAEVHQHKPTDAEVVLRKEDTRARLDRLLAEQDLREESDPAPILDRSKILPPRPRSNTGLTVASVAAGLLFAALVFRKQQAGF